MKVYLVQIFLGFMLASISFAGLLVAVRDKQYGDTVANSLLLSVGLANATISTVLALRHK